MYKDTAIGVTGRFFRGELALQVVLPFSEGVVDGRGVNVASGVKYAACLAAEISSMIR